MNHCCKCLVTAGGRALPHGREGVPGAEGGDRQAGGLHQRPVLHPRLVAHQVELETKGFLLVESGYYCFFKVTIKTLC